MSAERIAVIVEGDKRELDYWEQIKRYFFPKKSIDFLTLAAGENIYMLWKKMKEDDFETDIIEVVREYSSQSAEKLNGLTRTQFSEIYLFFDLDPHQNNLKKEDTGSFFEVLREMIESFDNETENGKLFISYPMCEAIRDFKDATSCMAFYKCKITIEEVRSYKQFTGDRNANSIINQYDFDKWMTILSVFLYRCRCLYGKPLESRDILQWYRKKVNIKGIFQIEKQLLESRGLVFVLSAFPEFLLDYFSMDYWKTLPNYIDRIGDPNCNVNTLSDSK